VNTLPRREDGRGPTPEPLGEAAGGSDRGARSGATSAGATGLPVWLLRNVGTAAACVLVGTFDRLVMPPGMPAGWWLASGIALAALWRWGPGCWPGVAAAALLGAALAGSEGLVPWLLAAAPAAALLPAALLLRRWPLPAPTASARSLARLTALAAGVGGVVAVVGVMTAWTALRAAAPDLPAAPADAAAATGASAALKQALLTWGWLSVGTLLAVLPLLAGVDQPPAPPSRRRIGAVALALAAAVVSALLALLPGPLAGAALSIVVLAVLALQLAAGLALASTALTLAAAVAAAGASVGLGPWPAAEAAAPLAVQLAAALAALGLVHLAQAGAIGRWRRWAAVLDGAGVGVAEWPRSGAAGHVSAGWRALAPGAAGTQPSLDDWLQQMHADDRPRLHAAIERALAGHPDSLREELRLPGPGGWRWLEATVLGLEADADGRPQRLLATLSDSGERHEALERQRLSASLFQHLHEGLLITDGEMRALDANPAYSAILGVPRDELLGSVPSLLRPAPADPIARQQRAAMWAALRAGGHWRGELVERRRSGEVCALQATVSSVLGPDLAVHYHVLVISDITEQRAQRERLERQAHFDELTRLPNRVRLSHLLDDAMRAADRDGTLLAVCYLDLDRFKPVNDRFGHAAGDRLLAELAGRLRSALRSRELWADAAARLGGDEFVLLLRAGTVEEARLAVERVLRVVAQPYAIDPAQDAVHVTASVGATIYPLDRSDADALLRHADHAMYGAKQAGRNGYLFFDPEHRRRKEQRVLAIGRVQEALDQAEFVLHYQPKVDMKSGRVLGLEALLRWDHPQQGLVAPLQFLPLIENTGLSARVGDWVFSQALEHLGQWRRAGLDISVSVNVSARHLQEPDFAQRLSELLARHVEPLGPWLELEMLETAAHADIEATSALMARCRALGVRFALDDFGTGYSTLTYLKRLPVEVLKIDRSFVHHMLDDAQDRAIVEGVIGLARTFACSVVAEGVESPAQARLLLELGCDIGQGTGIAAPMPASQVADWVREWKGMFALVPAGPAGGADGARLAG
jgi:diguanylate cyclase (GGDEF)-like protein/PAS domain S-box-containing protein